MGRPRRPTEPHPPKGTPTSLNLVVLGWVFKGKMEAPNQIKATDTPHMRRCLKAGLVEVSLDRTHLTLTQAGLTTVKEVAQGMMYHTCDEVCEQRGCLRLYLREEGACAS